MYHSVPQTSAKTSSGIDKKKELSLIWLACARIACRFASRNGRHVDALW